MTNTQTIRSNDGPLNTTSTGLVEVDESGQVEIGEAGLVEKIAGRVAQKLTDEQTQRDNEGLARHKPEKVAQLRAQYILDEIREEGKRRTNAGLAALDATEARQVRDSVEAQMNGLGPVQALLEDPTTTDVIINGCNRVFIKKTDGSKQWLKGRKVAASDDDLVRMVNARAQEQDKSWNPSEPELGLALESPTGRVDRLSAVGFLTARPSVTIRRPNFNIACLQDLVDRGTIDQQRADLLRALVLAKKNILVSGGTGTGKTTFLRCLMNEIPPEERLVSIEDPIELGLNYFSELHPDQIEASPRRANAVGKGEFTLRQIQRAALRQSPDRVILSEIRGPAAVDMVHAMTQGNAGSMSTIHADSAESALQRLQMYLLEAPERFTHRAVTMMGAEAVDFVVHIERFDNGRRIMTEIRQVTKETSETFIKSDWIFNLALREAKAPSSVGPNPVTAKDLQRGTAERQSALMRMTGDNTLIAARNQAKGRS